MTVKLVRDALMAAPAVKTLINDRIGPVQEMQNQKFPYVVLTLEKLDVFNTLQGSSGLARGTVRLDAWALAYKDAVTIAEACRTALDAAGFLCMGLAPDEFVFQQDSGVYRHGYQIQAWSS